MYSLIIHSSSITIDCCLKKGWDWCLRAVVGGVVEGGAPMLLQGDIYHAGPIISRGITSQPVITGLSPKDGCAFGFSITQQMLLFPVVM